MSGVTRINRLRNDYVESDRKGGRELEDRVDSRFLVWFKHMDEGRIVHFVMLAEVSVRRLRARPRYGWMDGVKEALVVARGIRVNVARERSRDKS